MSLNQGRVYAKLPLRQSLAQNRLPSLPQYGDSNAAPKQGRLGTTRAYERYNGAAEGTRSSASLSGSSSSNSLASKAYSGAYSGASSAGLPSTRPSLKRTAQSLNDENEPQLGRSYRSYEASVPTGDRPAKYRAVETAGERYQRPVIAGKTVSREDAAPPPHKRVALGDVQNNTRVQLAPVSKPLVDSNPAVRRPTPPGVLAQRTGALGTAIARATSGSSRVHLSDGRREDSSSLEGSRRSSSSAASQVVSRAESARVPPPSAVRSENVVSLNSMRADQGRVLGSVASAKLAVRAASPPRSTHASAKEPLRQRRNKHASGTKEEIVSLIRQPKVDTRRFSDRSSMGGMVLEVDPLMASEYADQIYAHWRSLEVQLAPDAAYMSRQPELSWDMRGTLVNWMVQVHQRFKLLPETLYLSISMLDRFLSLRPVIMSKFQLVGISALFIACKYEEIYFPSINDFVYACDSIYTIDEIRRAERYMLGGLNWELGFPGALNFLRRLGRADNYDTRIRVLSKYLVETTLVDSRFIGVPASALAAGAVWLARKMIHWEEVRQRRESGASSRAGAQNEDVRDSGVGFEIEWTLDHATCSGGYTETDIIPLAQGILDCAAKPEKHSAIFEKYSDMAKYFGVSDFVRRWCTSNGFS